MELHEKLVERIVDGFISNKSVIALGGTKTSVEFLKKLAVKAERENKEFKIIPSSIELASIASSFNLKVEKPDTYIDLSIEFADQMNYSFNFIKRNTCSLIRDKIIARAAKESLVIVSRENFVEKLSGKIPFEISKFFPQITLAELECFGRSELRMNGKKEFLTETKHFVADVEIDEIHSIQDIDFEARRIPGVLETGIFINYADKILIADHKKVELKVKAKDRYPGLELIEVLD